MYLKIDTQGHDFEVIKSLEDKLSIVRYIECEVQITLRPINQLYRVLDSNGYQVAPGYQYNPSPISFLYLSAMVDN